jgi:hypothetical protein
MAGAVIVGKAGLLGNAALGSLAGAGTFLKLLVYEALNY